jgi:hypothetical protein
MSGFKIYVCKDIRKKINQLKSTYIDQKEKKIWKKTNAKFPKSRAIAISGILDSQWKLKYVETPDLILTTDSLTQ